MGGTWTGRGSRWPVALGQGAFRTALIAPLLLLIATCQVDKLTNSPPPIARLMLLPGQVRDSAPVGSMAAAADSLSVANGGPGTLSWVAHLQLGQSWLAFVGPNSGTAPATLRIAFDPAGLPTGVYRDTVIVDAQNAANSPARVPVEFTVHPCQPAPLVVNAPPLTDSLTTADCAAPHRATSFARSYTFTAAAGDSISIVMASTTLDAYIALDSSTSDAAPPLATNDSCSGGTDACLRYQRLPVAGTYRIEATSAGARQTGVFTLSVTHPRVPAGVQSLAQLRTDSITAIAIGDTTGERTVVLRGLLTDPDVGDSLRLQVELQPVGTAFTGTPTATGGRVANGQTAFVAATGLANNAAYHWQARALDQTGRAGPWTAFGGNAESAPDFRTSIPVPPNAPTVLGQFQSDGQTVIAVGGTATGRSVIFKATVTDSNPGDQLRLDVEAQPVGTAFQNSPSGSGAPVANGGVATATLAGLSDNTAYHWQARAVDQTGRAGPWAAFGNNAETATDFRVAVAVTQLAFTAQPGNTVAGVAISPAVQVTAEDALGNTVTSFSGNVTVAIANNAGGGTLSGTLTVAAVNGMASFSTLSIDKVGSGYTLTASATGLTTTSGPFAITPAAARQLAFTTQPSDVPAGSPITPAVQVTAHDAFGNVATAFTGNVTAVIGNNAGGGTLSGATTQAAVAGVAAFGTLSIDKTGTGYTLVASGLGVTSATSTGFAVTPAAATRLVFTVQPANTVAGTAMTPAVQVTAQDNLGNTVTTFTGTVTIAIGNNPGGGTLSGTVSRAAVAGVAGFPGLSIDKAGAGYTLGASATGTAAAASAGFNITPAGATQLVFTVQPAATTAGSAITPAVQVTARDALGNTATGFAGNVTVAIGTNPGAGTLSGTVTVAATSGIATFANLSIDKSGSGYRLTAAATGLTGSPSAAFDVRPGTATRLAFTVGPPGGIANVALAPPVQVTAQDAFGNRDTAYTGIVAVALATNPGGATLSGTTSIAATAGAASFSTLRLDKAGAGYTLAATATGLTATTSTPFNIVAGSISPSLSTVSATPGVITASTGPGASTVTVTAKDASGNPVSGATVVLGATGTGNLLTPPAGPTDAAGVATGTLSSTVAEVKTLSATISGVAVTQTATVTVDPAAVSATHSSLVTAPTTITASGGANTATITVTARDGFDNPIPGATVVLGATGGGVTVTPPSSGTSASGAATGSASATLVGQKVISATINGVAVTQTDTLTVTPSAATALTFSVQPSNTTAGSTITPAVQVTARDQFGNTATGFAAGVTVALGANPGGGTLAGTLTRNAVAGVATFADLSVNKAGTAYTLTAAATGLPVSPSTAFDVAAGTGTQLVFTVQPTSDTARAILSPAIQVTAQDAIGNTISSFTGNVTVALGSNPGGGALAGTTTVTAVNGVATFSTLSLAKSGTGYTLVASTTTAGYNAPSSTAFDVAPGATSKLVFTAQPTNTVAGAAITPAVQVIAHDASDNVTPAFTGNVTMGIGTNPGAGVLSGTLTKPAVAGVATFADLSVNKTGVGYTLAAAASGLTGGTSSTFNVVAGPAAALAVTRQPSATALSGAPLTVQPQVRLHDANGNNVAQGNVTVTAAIATGPAGATLVGNSAVTGAGGLATFTGLAITGPAGSYRVAFTSSTLMPDTSTAITLSAGVATTLALTTEPSAAVLNDVAFPQQPVLQLQDGAGNPVTQSGVVVTAALATGAPALGGALTATTNASGAAAFATLKITGLVGSRTLSFNTTGLAGATSTTVVVSAGAATQIAVNAGNNQAATAGTAVATPPSVIVRDVSGNVVAGAPVTFAVPGTSNGSLTGPGTTTTAGGIAIVGSWTLSTTAKPDTMTAASTGLTGSPVTFVDTAKVGAAAALAKFSGDNQVGQVAESLKTPLVVRITDANGNPVPGVSIAWAAASGGGHVNPTSSTTGADGLAQSNRILGTLPGTNTTTATATLAGGPATVTFSATGQVGGATQMTVNGGDAQTDTVGHTLPTPLSVRVADALNNPVPGVTISWVVIDGGGSVSAPTSVSNASGVASINWTLGTAMSPTDSTQSARASGVGSPITFTGFTTPGPVSATQTNVTASSPVTASTGSSQSTIIVTARDQFGNVIKGKSVALAATGAANVLTSPAVPTDVNGVATGTLSSTRAETKTISATVGGVAINQQPAVVVTSDAANNLNVLTQPTNAVAGATIAPPVTVEIRDQFNNRVTMATNGVALVIGTNPSGGTLTGGGTVPAAAGVATFSALSLDRAGTAYTLAATSTGVAGATTTPFNISAAGVSASQSTVAATSPITAGGAASTITVTALDQFNNPIQGATVMLAASGTVNALTQPVGTTSASGVATGTLSSTVAEAKTVSATIGGVAVAQTATVLVNPGGAAILTFTQQPSSAVAGVAISPTVQVTARDANGNVATGFTGAVTLAFANNAGGGTLSGGGPVTAVNGVASFSNVSVDKVGAGYTLTASATGPASATSSAFNVAPAAATGLFFTVQPASALAGSAIAPAVQVTARDAFGNTATGFAGTVSIAIAFNAGGGTLSGTLSKPAVAGVVSFADLAVNKTGNGYTLAATAPSVAGATSGAFNITPAGATQLVFSQQPSNAVAGVAISPAVTVTALDVNNNVATGFAGSISVAIGANPGGGTLSGGGPVTAVNGVATFAAANLNKVGNGYTLTAASTGLTGATSTTFNVSPAAASALVFTVQPSNVVAGTVVTPAVQVTARDQFGNTATGFVGSVTVAIGTNPSGGTLSGTRTQPASAGVATFGDLSLDKVGIGYTLTVTSGALTSAPSAGFAVRPAPATQLVFTVQPTNAVSGSAIAPPVQVTARDPFGNTDTTYASDITVAIVTNPGAGVLSGASTVAAARGVATFSTLSIDKVGTGYQLGASATSLIGATSTAFNVMPAAATQLVFAQQPTDATASVAILPAITVRALDGSGNVATGFTGSVTLAIANNVGGGALTGTTTVAAVAGVATFSNLSINKAGTGYTLAATATSLTGATSNGFSINPAAASQLAFSVEPSTAVAGTSITPAVQVSARDAFGNTVPSFAANVTVAIGTNLGGGTLSGTVTVPAVSGVATFAGLSINKAATGYTLTASATGLGGATSTAFNITPAAAAQLVFSRQPPPSTAAGANLTPGPSVTAQDQFGNVATGFTGDVTMSIGTNPAGGTLSGTTTVPAVSGIATFAALRINKSGTGYTLVTSGTGLTPGTSAAFNITAGGATQVKFAQQPSNATAGTSISPAVTVTAQDANGNVVPTFTGNVVIALAANPAGGTLSGTLTRAAAAGVATFSDLSIDKAAAGYTLVASSGTLTKDTSTAVTITADGVSATLSTVTASSPIVASSGTSQSAITVNARDRFGNPIQGANVALAASGTFNTLNPPTGPTDVNGLATGMLSSTFAESKTVSATIGAVAITQTATVVVNAAAPTSIAVNAGNGQSAPVNTAVPIGPSVILRDQFNNPVPGVAVTFAVGAGGGTVNPTTPVITGTNGIATVTSWTLGSTAGGNTLTATASGTGIAGNPVTFTATGTAGAATQLSLTAQPSATAQGGIAFAQQPVVQLRDAASNAVSQTGVTVSATVVSGPQGATLSNASATTGSTGAASFSALAISGPTGTYTLSFGAAGLTSVTSGSVALSAASTTTSITGHTPSPSVVGQGIAVTYSVTSTGGTPTGNVTVSDGAATCVASVAAGTCTLTPTSVGAKTLTATYGGDANFTGSTSAGVNHTVNASGTTTTITTHTPDPSAVGQAVSFTFTVVANAPGSGTPTGSVTVSDGTQSCNASVAVGSCSIAFSAAGARSVTASYPGDGNYATSTSPAVSQTVGAASTSTTITGHTPNSSVVGQGIAVTYTVSSSGGTPTGNVTVSDGAATCVASVAAGTCTLTPTSAGTKTLAATYGGDANFAGSTSPGVAHTVNAAATTTAITGNTPNPSAVGQSFTVSYSVTVSAPGTGTPTGNVTVSDGTATCIGTVTAGGCTLTSTSAGIKTLAATYGGDANFAGSASVGVSHTVNAAATTTTITGHTPSPSLTGQAVNFTFTVVANAPGSGTPTGTVTVSDGTQSCNASVAVGSCSIAFKSAGGRSVTATYPGDANFATSASSAVPHMVNSASTTTTITTHTPNPSAVGQAVSFAFTVAASAPGSGTPTGNVTVSDGTQSCSASVAAGGCSIAFNSAGGRSVTATYPGDGNFATSTSASVSQSVGAASTTTSLTGHTPNPSTVGQGIAVTYSVTSTGGTPTGNVTVSDGSASCIGTVTGGGCTLTSTSAGPKTLTATYAGDGNFAGSTSAGVSQTVNAASTTTTITAHTPNPSVVGQVVNITFTVATNAPGSGTPTGTVTVSDGAFSCSASVATGTCGIAFGTAGGRTLTASYGGDGNFAGSTSAGAIQSVGAASTTTTITGHAPNPSVVGQGIGVNFTVTSTGGNPTGTVTVSDGSASCTGTVTGGGCTLTSTTAGGKTLTATYAGDGNFAGSTSAGVSHAVNPASTTTALAAGTPNPSVVGEPVTFTFTVVTKAPGSGTPTGTVTVSDGTQSCSASVTVGTCGIAFSSTGARTLTAGYATDGNFAGSTSTGVGQTVNTASTATTITGDTPDPSAVGQPYTVSYVVAVSAPGSGSPTGNVTVSDGAVTCTGIVASGSCSLASLTPGAKTLTASYAGNANFAGSTSSGQAHTVTLASTTTTITGHKPSPSVVGEGVAVTFTVTSTGGTPTGNVTVSDGASTCTATVASGTCTVTPTTAGPKTLTASYAGDGVFAASSSAGVSHTVNAASTTTTLTGNTPNPSAVGQAVTFTFTVAVNAPGGGTPSGTVTVSDGTQSCNASVAVGTCSITFNSTGGRSVTATYASDGNFAGSTSAGLSHTVSAASTVTTVTGHTPSPSVTGQPVAVTFTVTSSGGTPTGNVTVSDGAATCTASVATAACTLTPTTAGPKTLTASYAGDANFAASTSTGVSQTVNAASTTTTLTVGSPNPSVVGQLVSFAFTVAASAPGSGTPIGTVTVSDGTQSCNASVAAGTCSIAFSSAGPRTVTAAYAGDGNFAGSTSTSVGQTVNAASTTTAITNDSPNPSVAGQAFTVSFSVSSTGGTPTGNVTVSDGTVSCSGTVAAGSCSLTLTAAGAHTITATYVGDANFTGSSSAGESHTVNPAAASQLVFTVQPSDTKAGSPITPAVVVTARDQFGNTDTGFTGAITLNITSGTGTPLAVLSGTNPISAIAGVATYSNLSINLVGTLYSLDAAAIGLSGVTSGTFNITP